MRASGQKDKKCSCCKEIKPVDLFSKNKRKSDGMASECKACNKIRSIERYRQEDVCPMCDSTFKPRGPQVYCKECIPASQKIKSLRSQYQESARLKPVTPSWASFEEMEKIFQIKLKKEKEGIVLEIDHIVPISSPYVCGLNTPDNMRLISKSLNRVKNNHYWNDMADTFQGQLRKNFAFSRSSLA